LDEKNQMATIQFDVDKKMYSFPCPNCGLLVEVAQQDIACTIFRHAVLKASNVQIPPHSPQQVCEQLVKDDLVYGCAKPFKFNGSQVEICGYI
jgi:competence CoiA-like predicted nuclease